MNKGKSLIWGNLLLLILMLLVVVTPGAVGVVGRGHTKHLSTADRVFLSAVLQLAKAETNCVEEEYVF